MTNDIKTIELLSNIPIGKLSTGSCYEYMLNLRDSTKLIDLKSLKYNFEYNKYFQRIEVFINDTLVHSYICPDAIGNKSPYYFMKDVELLVNGCNKLCIKFTRNVKECDISDFKLLVDVIPSDSKDSKAIPTIKSIICPKVRKDGLLIVSFGQMDKLISTKKIVFTGFEVYSGVITNDKSFKIMNQMYDVICDKLKLGAMVEIDAKDEILYFKFNEEDIDNILNVFFNVYY